MIRLGLRWMGFAILLLLAFRTHLAAQSVEVRAPAELKLVAESVEAAAPEALARARAVVFATASDFATPIASDVPIVVRILSESSFEARATPPWVSGYAGGREGDNGLVLFPGRVGRYPDDGLEPLLTHELTHVLLRRATRGHEVPCWFNEGLAMVAAGTGFGVRARVALAVIRNDELSLAHLDRAFAGGETAVGSAYALAGDAVRSILAKHGDDAGARILARVGDGASFASAFAEVAGGTLGQFERDYWANRGLWDRWVPIVSSSVLLWGGISLLAIAAIRRRRARDRARLLEWEERERAAELALAAASRFDPPLRLGRDTAFDRGRTLH